MALDDMTCQELVEIITDYLEGVLPAADRAQFEQHLQICAACRAYVEQIRLTIALTGQLATDQIAPEDRAMLTELFRSWRTA